MAPPVGKEAEPRDPVGNQALLFKRRAQKENRKKIERINQTGIREQDGKRCGLLR